MNPAEYDTMAALEDSHWWYQGLRDLFVRILRRHVPPSAGWNSVLDVGCGTGANLRLLQDHFAPRHLSGFDNSPLAVERARLKVPQAEVYLSDIRQPELRSSAYDLIVCSDVLYVTGLASARTGLNQLMDHLVPGGLFLLHLPALNWLYSRHDVAVHTSHRFTRPEVRDLLTSLGLTPLWLTYRMFLLLPAVVATRLPSLLCGIRGPVDAARSDITRPPRPVNTLLRWIVELENGLIVSGMPLPLGSSLFALARKP